MFTKQDGRYCLHIAREETKVYRGVDKCPKSRN